MYVHGYCRTSNALQWQTCLYIVSTQGGHVAHLSSMTLSEMQHMIYEEHCVVKNVYARKTASLE